jgi:hypothetical protein
VEKEFVFVYWIDFPENHEFSRNIFTGEFYVNIKKRWPGKQRQVIYKNKPEIIFFNSW